MDAIKEAAAELQLSVSRNGHTKEQLKDCDYLYVRVELAKKWEAEERKLKLTALESQQRMKLLQAVLQLTEQSDADAFGKIRRDLLTWVRTQPQDKGAADLLEVLNSLER